MRIISRLFFYCCTAFVLPAVCAQSRTVPAQLKPYISDLNFQQLGGQSPSVQYEVLSDELIRVSCSWNFTDSVRQDDWQVVLRPAFQPGFHWAPHLTPTDDHI